LIDVHQDQLTLFQTQQNPNAKKPMRKNFLIPSIVAAILATAVSTQASLIQWLTATNVASIQISNTPPGNVTNWLDSSSSANNTANAGVVIGSPLYPSASLSASGQPGVDLGVGRNGFRLWSSAAQDSWLDFTGAASGKSGFAVLVAFKVDANPTNLTSRNIVIGGHGNPGANASFVLKYETGFPACYIGSSGSNPQHINSNPAAALQTGDTVVFAFNYDAATGFWELWDSKSGGRMTNTAAINGNFSSAQTMYLGTSENGGQFMSGDVFEVRVYDNVLTTTDLTNALEAMKAQWATPAATVLPPNFTSALAGDSVALLKWQDNNLPGVVSNFHLYRSLVSGSGYTAIATNSGISYNDLLVTNGTTYYYVLKAISTNGTESAFSAEVSVTPQAVSTNAVLIQHLDADIPGSVISVGGQLLTWFDQTPNLNDGLPTVGIPLHPSASLSGSGKAGVDLGANSWAAGVTNRTDVQLFTSANQNKWLNFTGAALTNGGFCALVAFKADSIQTGNARNTVLVNHGNPDVAQSFGLRFNENGYMQAFLGGTSYLKTNNAPVKGGDTIVYAFNYDERTGVIEFWDSKNKLTLTATNLPYGNFTSDQRLRLGTSDNNAQLFDGMVGEVKIYAGKLNFAALIAEGESLATKWGATVASTTDFYLLNLLLSSGTLNPTFNSNVLSYTTSVPNSVSNLAVNPTAASASSVISMRVNGGGFGNVTSGAWSDLLSLNEGANTVEIKVAAENPAYTQTYTVVVTRAPGSPTPEDIVSTVSGGNLILNWMQPTWKLATGTNVTEITNIISGATSPYTNSLNEPKRFYRLVYP
jgi:hypothetical protein